MVQANNKYWLIKALLECQCFQLCLSFNNWKLIYFKFSKIKKFSNID